MKTGITYFHTSEDMHEVDDESARFVFVSPPFTNNPDGETLDKQNYVEFLERVFQESYRTLLPDGIFVSLNTNLRDHARYNRGDRSFDGSVWLKQHAIREAAEGVGFQLFDEKVWVKSLKQNPYRFNHSHILFFQKRGKKRYRPFTNGNKHTPDFGPSVWSLNDSMNRKDSKGFVFHDAINPEIPQRCIREFTEPDDIVLSPFTGSGTVLAAAEELDRRWVGYEINRKLRRMIKESVTKATVEEVC